MGRLAPFLSGWRTSECVSCVHLSRDRATASHTLPSLFVTTMADKSFLFVADRVVPGGRIFEPDSRRVDSGYGAPARQVAAGPSFPSGRNGAYVCRRS